MNQFELEELIEKICSMVRDLSDDERMEVKKDVEFALDLVRQRNIFWMIQYFRKLETYVDTKKYILTKDDKLWIHDVSFNVSSLMHACESVLLKCGWSYDHLKDIYIKKQKIPCRIEYEIDVDGIPKDCHSIPMESVIVEKHPSCYIDHKMTGCYLEHIANRNNGGVRTGKMVADEWYNMRFNEEAGLLYNLWEAIPVEIRFSFILSNGIVSNKCFYIK